MQITVLTENVAGGILGAEHGISYLIETGNEKILFDTGHTDLFLKNANKLNIDINREVNKVVLSHGHWDHGNGLKFIENKMLITHPEAFMKRYRTKNKSFIGLSMQKEEIEQKFQLHTTIKPLDITSNLLFLGEIPRLNDFEAKSTNFMDDKGEPDFVPDDSAIVAILNDEIVIITGCSHSGICNIIDHAKKVTGINHLRAVVGGFHLKENNIQTQRTIEYLKQNQIKQIYPSHCTELPALVAFYGEFKFKQLKTGTILEF